MSHSLGIVIESLVAVLLMLTIGYCMLLNKRLKRLKADEHSLKATIAELITATEIAERAIGGLKHTVRDVNENLGSQLTAATQMSGHLKNMLAEGDGVIRRLSKIAIAARPLAGGRSRAAPRMSSRQGGCRGGASILRTQKGQWPRRMKSFRDIRVIPVVLVAIFGLAVLKIAGLVIDGGYVFDYQPSRAGQAFLGAGESGLSRQRQGRSCRHHRFGQEGKKEEAPKPAAPATDAPKPDGVVVFPEQNPQSVSPSERAILERLQARRQELEQRAREIEIRESLLKSAEKRIEGRVEEMKATEAKISTATGQKAEQDAARFKGIITMYEGMKPKDAAKVFDRLEMSVLYEIASQIAPRKMSDILGLMQPEAAERLTVELARRAGTDKSASTAELPKIEGKILPQKPN